ncbi:hypothetical protein [Variovorax paradoxus]|uniref:hypothetical protein n=1 Tax=Variovorax paradoxus TaxID=34073 RepID=UPI00339244FB
MSFKLRNFAFALTAIAAAVGTPPAIGFNCCSVHIEWPKPPPIPTPDQIIGATTQVVDGAGKVVGQVATDVSKEAGIGLGNVAKEAQIGAGNVAKEAQIGAGNVAKEAQIGLGNVATTIRKAGSDTGAQLNRSQHDLEDAGVAIYRYAVNEAKGMQDTVSHAEQRFREGKVVDALFHLGTEPLQNIDKNAAQAAQESSILSTVGSVAASVYGGPGGAAAYAAWLTYHQTGSIDMAIRVGIIAGASSWANGQAATMETGTVTDSIKRAAVVGAIGGVAVAASGGDAEAINQAFLRGGAAILVQDGYKAYVERNLTEELGPATNAPMCMAAPITDAANGCSHPSDYMKDQQGRLLMTDSEGNYHSVDPETEGAIPRDWRPIGDASKTPAGTPVVGIQTDRLPPASFMNEGSKTMVALAKVPGMNAMALFHDRWAVSWRMDSLTTKVSIVPAIVLTYMGATVVVDQASTTGITDAAAKSAQAHAANIPTLDPKASPASTGPLITTALAGLPPPTIAEVKPPHANLETLLCTKGASFRFASVIPGKEPGDLQCIVYVETDRKAGVPYLAKNTPGYCAARLVVMGDRMTKAGWSCKGR